jgi:hypothetical protein
MQVYSLLGTAEIQILPAEWHSFWLAKGWSHRAQEWGGIISIDNLSVEYETDWPNDAKETVSFLLKGRLQDDLVLLDDFVASLQALDASLSLDLFGDSARLVRRFVL